MLSETGLIMNYVLTDDEQSLETMGLRVKNEYINELFTLTDLCL